jgi:predicted transposase/invertase (TIGR01784 family)
MSDLTNPHDKFFKETFSRLEVARDFFANYLPEPVVDTLNLDTLALQSGSFIDPDLQEQFADLLYQVELKDKSLAHLYLLLEHKSYADPLTPFQLLRYMVRIWERNTQADEPLRPIIPTVVYHGREHWRVAMDFREMFTGPEVLQAYWPQFRYELQDLARLSDEAVIGTANLQIGMLLMKYILYPELREQLLDIFFLFRDLTETQTSLEYFRTVLYYIANASKHLTVEDVVIVVKQTLAEEGNDIMQTIAEYWVEQGVEQGVEEGRQILQESILDVLQVRFDLADTEIRRRITAVSDLTILRQLMHHAALAPTADEFLAHLPGD